MYVTTIIPTKENHTVEIPEEFYGKEVRISAEALNDESNKKNLSNVEDIKSLFSKYNKVRMTDFKFDRNEANIFDD
jgi:hypothetical protein